MKIQKPKDGDYRYVTKFLWMPRRFDGVWVWLETVTIRQIYFYHGLSIGWADVCLSNPLTGLPASFKYDSITPPKLLDIPMNRPGKYYVK